MNYTEELFKELMKAEKKEIKGLGFYIIGYLWPTIRKAITEEETKKIIEKIKELVPIKC